MLSMFLPGGYYRFPTPLLLLVLMLVAAAETLLLFISWRRMDRRTRGYAVGAMLTMVGSAALVVVGRPYSDLSHPWQPYWIAPTFFWYLVLVSLSWNAALGAIRPVSAPLLLKLTALAMATIVVAQTGFAFLDPATLSPQNFLADVASPSANRRAAIGELRDRLIRPLIAVAGTNLKIPDLSPQQLTSSYPSLVADYDLAAYKHFIVPAGSNVDIVPVPGDSPQVESTEKSLRKVVHPAFIAALRSDPFVRDLYLKPALTPAFRMEAAANGSAVSLLPKIHGARATTVEENGALLVEAGDASRLLVKEGTWDPESYRWLRLDLEPLDDDGARLELSFNGDLDIPYPNHPLTLPGGQRQSVVVDLLQSCDYALSHRIQRLWIDFPSSARYRIWSAELLRSSDRSS